MKIPMTVDANLDRTCLPEDVSHTVVTDSISDVYRFAASTLPAPSSGFLVCKDVCLHAPCASTCSGIEVAICAWPLIKICSAKTPQPVVKFHGYVVFKLSCLPFRVSIHRHFHLPMKRTATKCRYIVSHISYLVIHPNVI